MDRLDEALDFVRKAAISAHTGFDKIPWEELEALKNRRKADFIEGIEPLTARTGQIAEDVQFAQDFDFGSSDTYIMHELAKIDQFDGDKVRDAVAKALDPDKMKVIVVKNSKQGVHGDKRANLAFQTQSDTGSKEVPEVDPREALKPLKVAASINTLSNAKRFTLGNGMKVVLLPVDSMPLVAVDLQFDVGNAADPGTGELAARMLHQLDNEVASVAGISVRCESGNDTTTCSSGGVNIYLPDIVKSMERLVTAGDYSQEGIEEYQKANRDDMKRQESQTEFEFQRQLSGALYGPDHPYTRATAVAPSTVDKIGHDKLVGFKRDHYTAANATLIIAGNFDPKQGESIARSVFGGWSSGGKDAPVAPTQRERTGPEYIGVVGKEEPQTTIRILYPAPAGVDGQEAARQVLAQMLNERMEDIRFKLGSTYGTYARHLTAIGPTAYGMGGDVDTARTGESLKAMREGIAILQHVGAGNGTKEEMNQFLIDFVRARRKLIQVLLGQSTVSSELARRLAFISRYDLPADYYNQTLQRVAAVSPAQVMALIASELKPETEIIVTKGTREGIEKTFTDAGIPSVKIVEPEYK
jgi:predicted Zn-dependent peptidase